MKVGEHCVHNLETIARHDEQPGPSLPRSNAAVCCGTLQDPDAGGTHRHDPLAVPASLVDGGCGGCIDPIPLAVDPMLCRIVHAPRPKGVEADVQRDEGEPHPTFGARG